MTSSDGSGIQASLTLTSTRELGAGTSGAAYEIVNHVDGFRYCMKRVPLPDSAAHAAAANEARLHARLDHPGCVKYCYSWIDEGALTCPHFCLLLELCESDLWTFLEGGSATSVNADDRARWSDQLGGALKHLHERNILHRDLNPWNVMMARERSNKRIGGANAVDGGNSGAPPRYNVKFDVKLGDFGLSVDCPSGGVLSGHTTADGAAPLDESALTSLYSAPELGGAAYGFPVDVYSLGVTLYVIWASAARHTMAALVSDVEALRGGKRAELLFDGGSSGTVMTSVIDAMTVHEAAKRPRATEAHVAINEAARAACGNASVEC